MTQGQDAAPSELTGEEGKGFYPFQASIDAYGNGGFRFADMSHRGSILALPLGMYAWPDAYPNNLNIEHFARVIEQADQLDVLLVGTGDRMVPIAPNLRELLREHKIVVEEIDTGGAVRTYNILLGEHRAVGAALIAANR